LVARNIVPAPFLSRPDRMRQVANPCTALIVAAALIAVQVFATWRLRSGRLRNAAGTIFVETNQPLTVATRLGPILEPSATASD